MTDQIAIDEDSVEELLPADTQERFDALDEDVAENTSPPRRWWVTTLELMVASIILLFFL